MKIVLAPDSFKESMTAKEVANAMEKGIRKVIPQATCIKVPMGDGGEGTTQSLVDGTNGKIHKVKVKGPLGDLVEAELGILGNGETAVVEMASASGLQLISREERNPLVTTTYGTGQLIKKALDMEVKNLIIGIGGSATNDGGAGMFQALGGRLLDRMGNNLGSGGGELNKLAKIDIKNLDPRLSKLKVEVACDVNNPLTGETGASYVFGPQKGASPEMVEQLDNNLKHYGNIIKEQLGIDVANIPGSGAAGGLGAGLMAFLSAKLRKGIDLVTEYLGLEEKIIGSDYVFTGEGQIDFQTQYGKTPVGVSTIAKKYRIPTIVLAGSIGKDIDPLYDYGITAIFSILDSPSTLEEAIKLGEKNIERSSENIARLLRLQGNNI